MTQSRDLPKALYLTGLACAVCGESEKCRVIAISRGLFIATCTQCLHTTIPTRRIRQLMEMFAFGENPSEGEK